MYICTACKQWLSNDKHRCLPCHTHYKLSHPGILAFCIISMVGSQWYHNLISFVSFKKLVLLSFAKLTLSWNWDYVSVYTCIKRLRLEIIEGNACMCNYRSRSSYQQSNSKFHKRSGIKRKKIWRISILFALDYLKKHKM
jgi:hypothetical protein